MPLLNLVLPLKRGFRNLVVYLIPQERSTVNGQRSFFRVAHGIFFATCIKKLYCFVFAHTRPQQNCKVDFLTAHINFR